MLGPHRLSPDETLGPLYAAKHRFDVDNGRSIDGFNRADPQAALAYLAGDRVKSQRIWPVRRSRGEYARKWLAPV